MYEVFISTTLEFLVSAPADVVRLHRWQSPFCPRRRRRRCCCCRHLLRPPGSH